MKIVIPGGTGHVGAALRRAFIADGHEVVILSRSGSASDCRVVPWDGKTEGPWTQEIDGADVLLNLAGRSVDCRYHARNRAEMINSRIDSTRILGEAVAAAKNPPRVWLNASTATIYRHALDRPMDEHTGELGGNEPGAPSTWNFSIDIAKKWEATFFAANTPKTRRVAMRSAMTMTPDKGSVFDRLLEFVRLGLGGQLGNGKQYVSWIHEFDFVNSIKFLIEREDLDGAINISSPNPLPNAEFMAALRKAWGTPIGLPATKLMIEIGTFVLRSESELVLKSRRVVPTRLLEADFKLQYPDWPEASKELVRRWRALRRAA